LPSKASNTHCAPFASRFALVDKQSTPFSSTASAPKDPAAAYIHPNRTSSASLSTEGWEQIRRRTRYNVFSLFAFFSFSFGKNFKKRAIKQRKLSKKWSVAYSSISILALRRASSRKK